MNVKLASLHRDVDAKKAAGHSQQPLPLTGSRSRPPRLAGASCDHGCRRSGQRQRYQRQLQQRRPSSVTGPAGSRYCWHQHRRRCCWLCWRRPACLTVSVVNAGAGQELAVRAMGSRWRMPAQSWLHDSSVRHKLPQTGLQESAGRKEETEASHHAAAVARAIAGAEDQPNRRRGSTSAFGRLLSRHVVHHHEHPEAQLYPPSRGGSGLLWVSSTSAARLGGQGDQLWRERCRAQPLVDGLSPVSRRWLYDLEGALRRCWSAEIRADVQELV